MRSLLVLAIKSAVITTVLVSIPTGIVWAEDDDAKAKRIPLQNVVHIQRNKTGRATKVIVEEGAKVPKELLVLLPSKDTRMLSKSQIRELAGKHRLMEEWEVNPVLKFKAGDISFFYEEHLSAWDVELQFLARRIVLESAEEEEATIPSQGDLSALSNPVYSWLHKAARDKWKSKAPSKG